MDSSYGNGGQNIPGAKPGVIASGPDAPDIPGVTLESENPNGVLSKLSRKTGGSKMPVIDGGGGPKRSKKGLLFVGVALIGVALIVGIVAVLLMGKGNGNTGTSTNVSFNDLINYITSGKESKSDINDEYDITKTYYFLDGWNTEEEKSAIYAKTSELMDGFVATYKDGENSTLNSLVKSTKDLFDFIYAMNSVEKIYGIETTMTIIKDGDNKGKQKLVNHYTFSGLDNNAYEKDFLEVYNKYIDALTNKIKVYKENGCVTGNYIDDECMEGKTTDNFEEVDKYYLEVTRYYDLSEDFVENVYGINNLMHGKTLMGESKEQESEQPNE